MDEIQKFQEKVKTYQSMAEDRFRAQKPVREQAKKEIREKGLRDTESPERINVRETFINPRDGIAFERIIGQSDLLPVNYLDLGTKASRSVCRIQVRDEAGRMLGHGTGFLVSPVLLLTNNHVLDRIEYCRRSLADFNFEDDINFIPKDTKTFPLEPDSFFYTSPELDFTLVAVRTTAIDGTPLDDFGFLRMEEKSGKALLGEYVTVIQHPDGGTKQITLRENEVVDMPDCYIHYLTDTKPGSSGSPVFNDQWKVVALHHAGVQKKNDQGQVLSIDGTVWDPSMGEDRIAWEANEGIRISSICHHLREKMGTLPLEQQDVANGIFLSDTTSPAAEPLLPMEVTTQLLEWYEGSTGYDPKFLGKRVPLPKIPKDLKKDVAPLMEGDGNELKYTHFSVVMSRSRRLALFTAVNIDGDRLIKHKRTSDRWYFDPRIEKKYQSGPELYERNDLDRGHLVRRIDPVWGEGAEEANEDSFHLTNCSPQHKALNRRTWLNLEDYILKNAGRYGMKVVVFTGPVFRDDDMLYRGKFQVPAEYWKVAVMVRDDGKLSATAYLQTQKNLIEDLEFAYGEYKTYQVPLTKIESLARLNFGKLRNFDPLAAIEGTVGRVIEEAADIRL